MNNLKLFCQRLTWLATFFFIRLLGRCRITGLEYARNLPRPLLIIANHRSLWDPLLIGTLFPFFSSHFPLGFMVADVYYNSPLRPIFWLTNTYPAHKGKGLDVSLAAPRRIFKNRGGFVIFPAGKRQHLGRRRKPRRGAAALALSMPELTILPIHLKTMGNGIKKSEVVVGRPFKLLEKTQSRDIDEVAEILNQEIFKLNS